MGTYASVIAGLVVCGPSGVAQTTSAAMTRAYVRIGPSLFQDLLRNRVQLHVARPLVDRADLGVAVELLNRVLLGVAVAAKQDRKSTRLNSSHVRISYAVFCLRKKKRNVMR